MEFDNSISSLKSDQKNLIDTVVERVNTTVEEAKKNMKFETTSLAEELKSIRTMLAEQIVNIEILSTNIGELSSKLDMLILNNERNEKKWEDFNETLRDLEDILDDLKFQQRKIIEKLPP